MLPVKLSDNLKVSNFSLIFLTNANFCMFVRCFKKILNAVTSPAFYNSYVTIPTHSTPLESYIADNIKFYPFFKGALGALDGTHISACPPASDRARYGNRKGGISQNVLAATTFNMQFCYILSGWEGSASDGGVFHDAHVHDLVILPGKYYLADAGYPICDALLVPFHGVRYHLWEWESSGLQCVMFMASFSMPCLISWTGPRIIRSYTI